MDRRRGCRASPGRRCALRKFQSAGSDGRGGQFYFLADSITDADHTPDPSVDRHAQPEPDPQPDPDSDAFPRGHNHFQH